ncbi:mismatch repair ATPase (MutS family) [Belliella baltica DSM 15883]|uniref:Mismatch repair ATPase (MutS family) n=1 Tax=Belliella baltica (strain DSM 15883 / CIP 108006 / LMG 21964 / BA134) TaxID=866536 RepID=I3Z2T1_BELBD|nr:DNA mismatch repair protein [Belliella baltica]AFL83549.1 mismatch repair ATPase (MutS family) [Belliella baltica DSM 15883]
MIDQIDFNKLEITLSNTKKKAAGLSIIRLFLFFGIMAVGIVGLSEIRLLLILLPVLVGLFVYFIIEFNKQKDKEAYLKELIKMNEERLLRKERKLSSFNPGTEFQEKSHPFANDLDLFGEHSLYQLINHTVNKGGREKLVAKMKSSFNPKKAQMESKSIEELAKKDTFLQSFEALGRAFIKKEKSKEAFYDWIGTDLTWKSWLFIPMILGPLGGLAMLIGTVYFGMPFGWIGLWILLGGVFLATVFKPLQEAAMLMPNQGDIKTFAFWSSLLVKEQFKNTHLKELQQAFKNEDIEAPKILKSLEQKTFMIQNRLNLMYLIFNLLFWTDLFLWWRLILWKDKNGKYLSQWEKSFEEWQVLVSLSSFSNEENLSCKVNWLDREEIRVENLCHPLLHPQIAIGNDFKMKDSNHIVLLTGANMSGKTTFMRTLGINMVLANLGLSPFAKSFEMGSFQLFTSMRNSDNLGESVSSFYAELARIKLLLDTAESGVRVFFLLDEILKGTNTKDRIMGSEALIHQLYSAGGKGIISTHDIELSELETKLNYLVNKSFHSEITDQEIHFDYTIKDGPCPSFNAHKLMELMGIRFNEN